MGLRHLEHNDLKIRHILANFGLMARVGMNHQGRDANLFRRPHQMLQRSGALRSLNLPMPVFPHELLRFTWNYGLYC